jgi:hypothetical protein
MNARVDPRTGNITFAPLPRSLPLGPAPIRMLRTRRLGDIPNSSGAAGPLLPVYSEASVWNPPAITGSGSGPSTNSTEPTADPSQTGYMPASAPWGESDRRWTNPTTFATVPISAATNVNVPVLSQNYLRNALIIQNGSLANSPDIAPTLYVGFNAQPTIGSALALPPGVGVTFDIICPRDSIFIAFGPFTNGGGSVVIQGAVVSGTYAP